MTEPASISACTKRSMTLLFKAIIRPEIVSLP
jgi:hypothetical protein